jgi:hypothetical protein
MRSIGNARAFENVQDQSSGITAFTDLQFSRCARDAHGRACFGARLTYLLFYDEAR